MTLPASGQLSFSQINVELGNSSTSEGSMYDMATSAGKSTSNIGMDDWYGYSNSNISLNHASDGVVEDSSVQNDLTSSGAWTTTVSDPDGIFFDISAVSGPGNSTIYVDIVPSGPTYDTSATITFYLTSTALSVVWTFNYISI